MQLILQFANTTDPKFLAYLTIERIRVALLLFLLRTMRAFIFGLVFGMLLVPTFSSAHPGNTAADGCHYCRTNCDKWGVPWNERHCHNGGYTSPSYDYPSYTPKIKSCIEFGIGATYNSLTDQCECSYGYVVRNNQCVSENDACEQDFGYNAKSTFGGKCECEYGYKFDHDGDKCISDEEYCKEIDWNAEYDFLTDSCVCKKGYKAGISGTSCVLDLKSSTPKPTKKPSYFQSSCPKNSFEDPLNTDQCICSIGYKPSSDFKSCIKDSQTSSSKNQSSQSNNHMICTANGCSCELGYKKSGGTCTFSKCPSGYEKKGDSCLPAENIKSGRVACSNGNKKPCKCKTGYKSVANQYCIPK